MSDQYGVRFAPRSRSRYMMQLARKRKVIVRDPCDHYACMTLASPRLHARYPMAISLEDQPL